MYWAGRRVSKDMRTAAYWEASGEAFKGVMTIVRQVENWSNMTQLVGNHYSGYAALRKDGTVISTGVVCNVYELELVEEEWTDIIQIVSARGIIYGLKSDGTIHVHVSSGWRDILDRMQLEKSSQHGRTLSGLQEETGCSA